MTMTRNDKQGIVLVVFGRLVGHVNAATLVAGVGGVVYAGWNEFHRLQEYKRALTALNLKCKRLMEARRAAGLLRLARCAARSHTRRGGRRGCGGSRRARAACGGYCVSRAG